MVTDLNKTNIQDALVDMVKALKPVFKKYSRYSRTEAWEKLSSKRGDDQMKKILIDPDRPINTFKQLAFKEWLANENLTKISQRKLKTDTGAETIVDFKIFRNPDYSELQEVWEADKKIVKLTNPEAKSYRGNTRGLLADNDIYIWPEHGAMHYQISNEIGLKHASIPFYLSESLQLSIGYDDASLLMQVEQNPHYQRMIGKLKTTSSVPTTNWKKALKPEPGKSIPLAYESFK